MTHPVATNQLFYLNIINRNIKCIYGFIF